MPESSTDIYIRKLAEKRSPAIAEAERLIRDRRYEAAEAVVFGVDQSIYAWVDLADAYERVTADAFARKSLTHPELRELACRAILCAWNCYPEPHIPEEAESAAAGRTEILARFVRLLGFDPMN